MFETRLKALLVMLAVALAVVVARLVDMQVLHADDYRRQAEDALLMPMRVVPAVRGRILDRAGRELATEEACWDVKIDYGLLASDPAYLAGRVDRLRREKHYGGGLERMEVERRFQADVQRMWEDLAQLSGQPVSALQARARETCERIAAIREAVTARRGFESPIREERMQHAILDGLDNQQQVAARDVLQAYPWVVVEDSTRRVGHADETLAHILGRTGPVTAEHMLEDRLADDPLRKYLGDERLGVTGVERAAETILRGRRGQYQEKRDGLVIESVLPEAGGDVHLTIRPDLQRRIYDLLARDLADLPNSSGGSVVVLDVPTREVLAMVSYPGYDPQRLSETYGDLRRDTRHQPLRFRAVANYYAPGSIVKPLICLAGLTSGRITLDTTFDCQGALSPSNPRSWRCWVPAGGTEPMRHGLQTAEDALKNSCNVFMYRTGELTGVEGLCNWFDMAGFGRRAGTGLVEEAAGLNPTPSWLATVRGRPATAGDARNFAIGQGELGVTPVQAANLIAVYASGVYRPVVLIRELASPASWTLPGDPAYWTAIRRGMYRVVNEVGGTAHKTAFLDTGGGYALCGKTGSAQATPWPISYRITYTDPHGRETVAILPATTRDDAIADFVREHPDCAFSHADVVIHQRWPIAPPETGRTHSHAWFAGFLQELDSAGQPRWDRHPRVAFAVLVEFGGSGGHAAAPIGRKIADALIQVLGPDLDANTPSEREDAS